MVFVLIPSLSLGTFSPAPFFHPLLRESRETLMQGDHSREQSPQQMLQNCLSQPTSGIQNLSSPTEKAPRLAYKYLVKVEA
jgi:hypothetical protein